MKKSELSKRQKELIYKSELNSMRVSTLTGIPQYIIRQLRANK